MLGIFPRATQKCADINIGYLTARWDIRFMPDKYLPGSRIPAEKPPISIGAAIQLSPLQRHRFVLDLCYTPRRARRFFETKARDKPRRPAGRQGSPCDNSLVSVAGWFKSAGPI